jgi:hypothetical protein
MTSPPAQPSSHWSFPSRECTPMPCLTQAGMPIAHSVQALYSYSSLTQAQLGGMGAGAATLAP